uniref:Uncharacterized protein n=1 Tax=Cacopsylla melanoneura TaxID=428564 RepID=A0A8D8LIY0_9HEMI
MLKSVIEIKWWITGCFIRMYRLHRYYLSPEERTYRESRLLVQVSCSCSVRIKIRPQCRGKERERGEVKRIIPPRVKCSNPKPKCTICSRPYYKLHQTLTLQL